MGFLNAVYNLGELKRKQYEDGEFADIDSFLQMPADLIEAVSDEGSGKGAKSSKEPAREIRVWLDVVDPQADCLEIRGIKKIDLVDFWGGYGDERVKKRRYLYRDQASRATWHYSPLYKLGGGVKDVHKALLGESGWRTDKESRFYKLYNATLRAFEERGIFSPGSVDLVMTLLEERMDNFAELWTDKKRSYLLIFSPADGENFLYPVEVKSLLGYFRSRLNEAGGAKVEKNKKTVQAHEKDKSHICSMCCRQTVSTVNLDKVFAFATFDKKSFLPGLEDSDSARAKMFPLCPDCYQTLSEGRNAIDSRFLDGKSIYGVKVWMVPELLFSGDDIEFVSAKSKNFLKIGISNETYLSKELLEQDDSLVCHFVFWEKNQAQERLLLMLEDVPPTRLKRLEQMWIESIAATRLFGTGKEIDPEDSEAVLNGSSSNLDHAVKTIVRSLSSLGGKNENDVGVLRDRVLDIVGRLLDGRSVDVGNVKALVVSRLRGLCADSEWVARWSSFNLRQMECVIDFLYRVNENITFGRE